MENKTFKIEGLTELEGALKELPVNIQQQIYKSFMRKAGKKFIVDELKTVLSYSSKSEDSIKVVQANDDKMAVQAGVTGKGYKLRWADLGTKQRKTKKGANRGQIEGKKQIQPVIERQIEPIVTYMQDEIANHIDKYLNRKLKKMRKM